MLLKVCLDYEKFLEKKKAKIKAGQISKRIAGQEVQIELKELAYEIGNKGRSYAPAIFNGGRDIKSFKEMQLFCLDFDDGNILFEDVLKRCKEFKLKVAFAYETLSSSKELFKFRVGFVHEAPISHKDIALFILRVLIRIFPEADKSCTEISRMFFGGKNLFYYDESEPVFMVDDLAHTYQMYSRDKDYKHFAENQRKLVKGMSVLGLCESSLFCIDTYENGRRVCGDLKDDNLCDDVKIGDYLDTTNIYILELSKKSRKIIFQFPIYQQDMCQQMRSYLGNHVKVRTISKMCRLWNDFESGEYLSHDERLILATNAIHIKGLEKVFIKLMSMYYSEKLYAWKYYVTYFKAREYKPKSCEGCPYAETCIHEKNMVQTVIGRKSIVKLDVNPKYVPIEKAYEKVYSSLVQAVCAPNDGGIHCIKAQTSIGKTEAFVNLIKEYRGKKPLLIAAPLVRLKEEISNRLPMELSEQILSWTQIELPEEITREVKYAYSLGYYKDAKEVINHYLAENCNKEINPKVKNYFDYMEILKKAEKHMVVTHAQLRNISEEILQKYEIIIDEDILISELKNTGRISVHEVRKLMESGMVCGTKYLEIMRVLEDKENGFYRSSSTEKASYIKQDKMYELGIYGDVNGLLNAHVYHLEKKESGEEEILFCQYPHLPKQKVTILSATLDIEIYQRYFTKRKIYFYDIPKVKYNGRLVQYPLYSLSRKNIKELCEEKDMTCKELYQQILSFCGDYYYGITFKKYEMYMGERTLHFGNGIGVDHFKGKVGAIIGTAFLNESSYKMAAALLGEDVTNQSMGRRRVTYEEYEFPLNTYENQLLRRIQLYFLSSEMEQCVGRSRLLRTDATVYLFSSFPCSQAEINYTDYLKEKVVSVPAQHTNR